MIGDENLVYNMPGGIMVDELLDSEKVKKVFEKIIERHSILKTSFIMQDNNVVQKIRNDMQFEVSVYYNKESEIQQIISKFSRPFKLEQKPLIKVEIHYIDNRKTLLLV